ncbi:MAG: hypothetical protein LBV34_26390 [Nocardiopsaceae bacterium]|nr:hypothetical protein [Nocardiopsaceae bacterium]
MDVRIRRETRRFLDDVPGFVPKANGRVTAHRPADCRIKIGIGPRAALVGSGGRRRDGLREAAFFLEGDSVDIRSEALGGYGRIHGDRGERDSHERQRQPSAKLAYPKKIAVALAGAVERVCIPYS